MVGPLDLHSSSFLSNKHNARRRQVAPLVAPLDSWHHSWSTANAGLVIINANFALQSEGVKEQQEVIFSSDIIHMRPKSGSQCQGARIPWLGGGFVTLYRQLQATCMIFMSINNQIYISHKIYINGNIHLVLIIDILDITFLETCYRGNYNS